jgi:rare lipoprotein A (peptidoglycan hydrolase)
MSAVVLALVLAAMPGAVPDPPAPLPDRPQPQPEVGVVVKAAPAITEVHPASTLAGTASWYDYRPGQGAAGPRLRSMLGKDWRGQTVRVCKGDTCISVRLTDWCQCYKGERRERIIDLDVRSFAALDDPGAGLTKVTIYP